MDQSTLKVLVREIYEDVYGMIIGAEIQVDVEGRIFEILCDEFDIEE